ncbi:MAG TPA: arginine deiminase family protein [Pirellulaceae bacterium]|nr:arginine deiminase family protein [Pirellulaceae bacterium]
MNNTRNGLHRRAFLQASLAAGVGGGAAIAAQQPARAGYVTSEVGRLKRVIVHEPGAEVTKAFPLFLGNHSMLTWELLRNDAAKQHQAFVGKMKEAGVEVLDFEKLLEEALTEARRSKRLGTWLAAHAPALVEHEAKLMVDTLLGRDDRFIYRRDATGAMQPAVSPATVLFFTRDLAVMTPRGLVLGKFEGEVRSFEAALTRFIFQNAPQLAKYQVAFDAAAENVLLQGGDVLVLDDRTLLVGVGNATDEKAAQRLAQKLSLDVVAVQMPSKAWQPGEWEGLQLIFYHLDCLVNLVDLRTALAVPYLLEKAHARQNPILDVLYGFARLSSLPAEQRLALLDEVRNIGWIRRYQAGSGELDKSLGETKVVDYLKEAGFKVIYAGGERRPDENDLQHVVERVIRGCRFMSVNVLAVRPGELLSYEGNTFTLAALEQAGLKVTTFPSHELVRANGGPHCLTMPLERD